MAVNYSTNEHSPMQNARQTSHLDGVLSVSSSNAVSDEDDDTPCVISLAVSRIVNVNLGVIQRLRNVRVT